MFNIYFAVTCGYLNFYFFNFYSNYTILLIKSWIGHVSPRLFFYYSIKLIIVHSPGISGGVTGGCVYIYLFIRLYIHKYIQNI